MLEGILRVVATTLKVTGDHRHHHHLRHTHIDDDSSCCSLRQKSTIHEFPPVTFHTAAWERLAIFHYSTLWHCTDS